MVSDLVRVEEIPRDEAEDVASWISCLAEAELENVYPG